MASATCVHLYKPTHTLNKKQIPSTRDMFFSAFQCPKLTRTNDVCLDTGTTRPMDEDGYDLTLKVFYAPDLPSLLGENQLSEHREIFDRVELSQGETNWTQEVVEWYEELNRQERYRYGSEMEEIPNDPEAIESNSSDWKSYRQKTNRTSLVTYAMKRFRNFTEDGIGYLSRKIDLVYRKHFLMDRVEKSARQPNRNVLHDLSNITKSKSESIFYILIRHPLNFHTPPGKDHSGRPDDRLIVYFHAGCETAKENLTRALELSSQTSCDLFLPEYHGYTSRSTVVPTMDIFDEWSRRMVAYLEMMYKGQWTSREPCDLVIIGDRLGCNVAMSFLNYLLSRVTSNRENYPFRIASVILESCFLSMEDVALENMRLSLPYLVYSTIGRVAFEMIKGYWNTGDQIAKALRLQCDSDIRFPMQFIHKGSLSESVSAKNTTAVYLEFLKQKSSISVPNFTDNSNLYICNTDEELAKTEKKLVQNVLTGPACEMESY